jgi:hypothetical protein
MALPQPHFQPIILKFIAIQFQVIGKALQKTGFLFPDRLMNSSSLYLYRVKSEIDFVPGSIYFVMNKEDMYHDKAYE